MTKKSIIKEMNIDLLFYQNLSSVLLYYNIKVIIIYPFPNITVKNKLSHGAVNTVCR